MTTKTVRRIVAAGVAGGAALVLAAAPAGASSNAVGGADGNTAGGRAGSVSVTNGPAARSASAYQFAVVRNACFAGNQKFTVRQIERGQSGTVRFRQTAAGFFLTTHGWVRQGNAKFVLSNGFPNDSRTFTFQFPWQYTYGPTAPASHRLVLKLDWLSAGGGVIATTTLTQTCA
jgi:hypothetical protein